MLLNLINLENIKYFADCCRWLIIEMNRERSASVLFPLHAPSPTPTPTPIAINTLMHIAQEPMRSRDDTKTWCTLAPRSQLRDTGEAFQTCVLIFFKERQSPNPKVNNIERHLTRGPEGHKIPRDLKVITRRMMECVNDVGG